MRRVGLVLVLALGVTAGVAAQKKGGDPKLKAVKNPVAASAASITTGRALYGKQCRHCHGLRGLGDGPLAPKNPSPANLTDAKWDHGDSDGEIFAVIFNGAPPPKPGVPSEMKGMKGTLPEKEVWNIVNFIRSIGPKPGATPGAKPGAKPAAKPAGTSGTGTATPAR
jgi:mono/diheme cytochrome c family protein